MDNTNNTKWVPVSFSGRQSDALGVTYLITTDVPEYITRGDNRALVMTRVRDWLYAHGFESIFSPSVRLGGESGTRGIYVAAKRAWAPHRDAAGDCCLCGGPIKDQGHNPTPLSDKTSDRCCEDCNWEKVIPARLHSFTPANDETENEGAQ